MIVTRLEKGCGANPEGSYVHMSTQRKGRLSGGRLGVRVDESMLSLLCLCVQDELSLLCAFYTILMPQHLQQTLCTSKKIWLMFWKKKIRIKRDKEKL